MSLIYKTIAAMNAMNRDDMEDKDAQIAALRAEVARLIRQLDRATAHIAIEHHTSPALVTEWLNNDENWQAAQAGEGNK